jgi:hypothetical protein
MRRQRTRAGTGMSTRREQRLAALFLIFHRQRLARRVLHGIARRAVPTDRECVRVYIRIVRGVVHRRQWLERKRRVNALALL